MINLIFLLVFLSVAALIWSIYSAGETTVKKRRLWQRLQENRPNLKDQRSNPASSRPLITIGRKLLPRSGKEREAQAERLDRIGFHAYHALELFYGFKTLTAIVAGAMVFVVFVQWRGLTLQTLIFSYFGLMLGYYLPSWLLRWREKKQFRQIINELPDALDILLVCMNAGLSFDHALLRVSGELRYVTPVIAKEFERYFYEVESGLPRQDALTNLARRNQVDALTSIVNVLVQSMRFGTDIAQALRIHADSLRMERKQLAEEKAAKVSTKLVVPTVIFIMPALILVVLGPAVIRLLERVKSVGW